MESSSFSAPTPRSQANILSKMESGKKNLHLLLLPLFFFSCSLGVGFEETGYANLISSSNESNSSRKTIRFDVGVILDTNSWIGNISWSCMRMAADEFYAANPDHYSTRLSLHLRHSGGGDAFQAAAAGIDLLKNVRVQAIIGPQTSIETRFVMKLGDKAHVPVMSFSDISPPFSTKESPYYIHTSLLDSTQAKVICSIVQQFRWSQVVLVFEDSEHGNGIVPYLIDAFQEINVRLPYRSIIPPSATREQILKELNKLKSMQTRVFVAHLTCNLGLQLFSIAKEEGMLEEGYVWITTYALTNIVHLMGSSATDVMQGVVGIKPYAHETRKLQNFKQRWRNKFHQENPHTQITEPTLFGLWAYDTVWSLALAAERVRMAKSTFKMLDISNSSTDLASIDIYSNGPKLLEYIQRTNFDGMVGKFHLVDNQLEQTFEILNLVGNSQRRIGFWSLKHGISGSTNSTGDLDVVTWPGATQVVPKGWEWPTRGKKLRIAVPAQPGFSKFLYTEGDPHSNNLTVAGYSIDVFKAAMKELPYVSYELIPYGLDSSGKPISTYNDIVDQVYLKKFDAVVGDISILANRSLYVDFTLPYTSSGVSMLVPVKDKLEKGAWTFLKPLDINLWMASGAFFIFTGFVVWLIEHRINEEFRGAPGDQLGTVLYFSFSSLVFTHREKLLSNLSRFLVVVWVFVVLILRSIYTANLSSMLTIEQLQPTVRDLEDLIKLGINVGYMNESFMPYLFKQWKFDESKLIPFNSPYEYHKALSNGTLAVFVDETPYLKFFLNEHCGKYRMVGPIYKTHGFGYGFPKGSLLVHEVSRAILKLLESDQMLKMEEKLYGNKTCNTNEDNDTSLISLTFRSFWGLFLITGVASITALFFYLASFLHKHGKFLCSTKSDLPLSRRLAKLAEIYDQMYSTNPTKTSKAREEQAAGNVMTPVLSGPESPFSTPGHAARDIN